MRKYISLLFLMFFGVLYAQKNYTIHLIDFYDNVDARISVGCKVDRDGFRKLLGDVSQKLNVPLKLYNEHNEFDFEKLIKTYSQMDVKPNDVLVFMYSGHGFHSTNQHKSNPYPFMFFKREHTQKHNLLKVHQGLLTKKARLTITFGDMCNNLLTGPSDDDISFNVLSGKLANYIRLFSKSQGDIIATSSDRGQVSWVRNNDDEGSYFTHNFLLVINHILENPDKYDASYDWNFIFNKTKEIVIHQTTEAQEKTGGSIQIQTPIFNINVKTIP